MIPDIRDRFRAVMTELNLTETGPDADTFVDGHADAEERARHVAAKALAADRLAKALEAMLDFLEDGTPQEERSPLENSCIEQSQAALANYKATT